MKRLNKFRRVRVFLVTYLIDGCRPASVRVKARSSKEAAHRPTRRMKNRVTDVEVSAFRS